MNDRKAIRIGVDVGGTNTDICAVDEESGELMVFKISTRTWEYFFTPHPAAVNTNHTMLYRQTASLQLGGSENTNRMMTW